MKHFRRRTPGPDALRTYLIECKSCGASEQRHITIRKALHELFGKCEKRVDGRVCGGEQSLTVVEEN